MKPQVLTLLALTGWLTFSCPLILLFRSVPILAPDTGNQLPISRHLYLKDSTGVNPILVDSSTSGPTMHGLAYDVLVRSMAGSGVGHCISVRSRVLLQNFRRIIPKLILIMANSGGGGL